MSDVLFALSLLMLALLWWPLVVLFRGGSPPRKRADPVRIDRLERELRIGPYADPPPRPRRPAQLSPRSPLRAWDDDEVYEVRAWNGRVIRVVGRRKGGE